MQPTLFQRLFTDNRPLYFLMAAGAVTSMVFAGAILLPVVTPSLWNIANFIILMLVAACLGAVLGAFPCGILLGGLLRLVERKNGAPFHEGDEILILSRRFPGRVSRIYRVWDERHQVRVELGEDERKSVTDVFSYSDICRLTGPDWQGS